MAKYRCPTCLIRYCSLACYKTHKAKAVGEKGACVATNPSAKSEIKAETTSATKEKIDFKTAHASTLSQKPKKLRASQFAALENSNEVVSRLKSSQLQEVIKGILASKNPSSSLKNRIEGDPYFAEFADHVLLAVGAAHYDEDGEMCINIE